MQSLECQHPARSFSSWTGAQPLRGSPTAFDRSQKSEPFYIIDDSELQVWSWFSREQETKSPWSVGVILPGSSQRWDWVVFLSAVGTLPLRAKQLILKAVFSPLRHLGERWGTLVRKEPTGRLSVLAGFSGLWKVDFFSFFGKTFGFERKNSLKGLSENLKNILIFQTVIIFVISKAKLGAWMCLESNTGEKSKNSVFRGYPPPLPGISQNRW